MTNNNPTTKTYSFANSYIRLIARVLDLLLISLLCFCISLLFFINSSVSINDLFKPIDPNNIKVLEGSRVFGIGLISLVVLFIYFIVIPVSTKGYTLFKLAFKIKVYNDQYKSYWLCIFKREVMIWMLFAIVSFINTIVIFVSNDTYNVLKGILDFEMNTSNVWFWYGSVIKFIYSLCGLINIVLVIYMMFNNKKRAIQDNISYSCVISTKALLVENIEVVNENNNPDELINTKSLLTSNLNNLESKQENKYWNDLQEHSLLTKLEKRKAAADRIKPKE